MPVTARPVESLTPKAGDNDRPAPRETGPTAEGAPDVPEAEELFGEKALARLRSDAGLAAAVRNLRQREAELSALAEGIDGARLTRLCLASTAAELREAGLSLPKGALDDPESFFLAVCALPFSSATAGIRRRARETSRLAMLMRQGGLCIPACVGDFHRLWEQAMLGEPRWSEECPSSRFRTGEVTVRGRWPERKVLHVCMDAHQVPLWLDRLVALLADEGMTQEVRASCGLCLHDWIHPFEDGNGHTGRLLAISMLSAGYSQLTLAFFTRELTADRATTISLFGMLRQRETDACGFCRGLLGQLEDAQTHALRALGGGATTRQTVM